MIISNVKSNRKGKTNGGPLLLLFGFPKKLTDELTDASEGQAKSGYIIKTVAITSSAFYDRFSFRLFTQRK
jgi:hypothetical protein